MKNRISSLIIVFTMLLGISCSHSVKLVTGSYSQNGESGINVFDFNESSGRITPVDSFNAGPNPSFIIVSKKHNLIYAINEVDSFTVAHSGGLTTVSHDGSFRKMKKEGELTVPNGGPCHLSLSPDEAYILIANYGGGSVAVAGTNQEGIPLNITDTIVFRDRGGRTSHAHKVHFDPTGDRVYVTDLGLDKVWIFNFDRQKGKLIPFDTTGISLPPGTGPRHFMFNKSATILYVIGELNSTVTVFKIDEVKGLLPLQSITTRRSGYTGPNACADIRISKDGKYLWGSNRGENSIVTYRIKADGKLELSGNTDCGGDWPRNFTPDPSGKFLLVGNQKSDNIAVFRIDQETGMPSEKVFDIKVKAPVCLRF